MSVRSRITRGIKAPLAALGYDVVRQPEPVVPGRFDPRLHHDPASLPPALADVLREDNPRLTELRRDYEALDWPVLTRSRWRDTEVTSWLHLGYFRGDNMYIWHYRRDEAASRLFYYVYAEYVQRHDRRGLLEMLGEDGAFGCWTFDLPGLPTVSRDLLDSVGELSFLDRALSAFDQPALRLLDIGAGYGRLAHRAAQVMPNLTDYACVDAIPESTFLSEVYLEYRQVAPPARVVPLTQVPALTKGGFDLCINIHSFSECPLSAIEWWLQTLARLEVPRLLIVPNEPEGFLSTEPDRSRRDYGPLLARYGYRLVRDEKVVSDPAVRTVLGMEDRYCLFERS